MPENRGRVVDLFLIHTENHYNFDLTTLPAPFPDWQYRVYADKEGKEHKDHGVDPFVGAMALVRPDGYIGLVTGLDGGPAITGFMDNFMVGPKSATQGEKMNGSSTADRNGITIGNGNSSGNGTANGLWYKGRNGVTDGTGMTMDTRASNGIKATALHGL